MDKIVAIMMLVLMSIISISIVINSAGPSLDRTKAAVSVNEAENTMKFIDNAIKEVAAGGNGTKRALTVAAFGSFEVIPGEHAIEFSSPGAGIFEYLSRRFSGNLVYIAGNDVSCSDSGNFTMENTYIRAVLNRVPQTSPLQTVDTSDNIISIMNKASGNTVIVANSSITVHDNASTSFGNGYSEISRTGSGLSACLVHFFVNSTKDYDIYYTLYAGADFLVTEVRNVRD